MKRIIKIGFFSCLVFLITSCGFEPVNKSNLNNFSIKEIITTGDKRINYKIKNKISINSKNNNRNLIIVSIETEKTKTIKEKNIKNQITKYKISLICNLKINVLSNGKIFNKSLSTTSDYQVAVNYSTTLNNEKKITDTLINNVSEKILDEINLVLNDL